MLCVIVCITDDYDLGLARHNDMIINLGKTKEIIFYNPVVIPNLISPLFSVFNKFH